MFLTQSSIVSRKVHCIRRFAAVQIWRPARPEWECLAITSHRRCFQVVARPIGRDATRQACQSPSEGTRDTNYASERFLLYTSTFAMPNK